MPEFHAEMNNYPAHVTSHFKQFYQAYMNMNSILPLETLKTFIGLCGLYTGQQGDQHEFLSGLLNILHEDFSQKIVFHPSDLADQSFQCNGLSINADRHLSGKQYGYTSPTVQLFTGQQHGEIVCQCGAISNRFEVFRTIELPISGSNVRDCLNKYTDIDVLPDYACDSCGQKCMAANRVTFWRLPPILTFAIKRTVYHQTGRPTKDNTILQAPDMLELQSFMTRGEAQPYKLFAIANHSGDANFGHCYTTLKTDGVWYILNDHQITPLSHRSDSPNDYIYWYARGDAT